MKQNVIILSFLVPEAIFIPYVVQMDSHTNCYECLFWYFPCCSLGRKLPAETKGKPGCNCSRQKTELVLIMIPKRVGSRQSYSDMLWIMIIIIITYMFGLTCDFPPRVSVSASVLQEEITVGFVRNPKLERVFQHNFFRSNPHPHTHTRLVLLLFLVHTRKLIFRP